MGRGAGSLPLTPFTSSVPLARDQSPFKRLTCTAGVAFFSSEFGVRSSELFFCTLLVCSEILLLSCDSELRTPSSELGVANISELRAPNSELGYDSVVSAGIPLPPLARAAMPSKRSIQARSSRRVRSNERVSGSRPLSQLPNFSPSMWYLK